MKLLKNRFFVTVTAVALVLCIVPTVLSATGHGDIVRSGVGLISVPFRAVFNWAADGVSGFGRYFAGVDALIEENERLRRELDEYRAAAARADIAQGENEWLRAYLGFTSEYPDYKMLDASVTGRSSNSYSVTYTLNRGSESGIEVNMAVVTAAGAAGYVREVGVGWCRVAALTDPTTSVGVYEPRTGTYGLLEGSVKHRRDGLCVFGASASGLPELAAGDKLSTSGYGKIFPAGMAVGEIVSAEKDAYAHSVTYTVRPAVDFDSLTYVIIILGVNTAEVAG